MNDPAAGDQLDDLRRANPVAPDELPSVSLARVHARVEEATRSERTDTDGRRRFSVAGLGAGIAVATIAVLMVIAGGFLRPPSEPSPSGLGVGFCVEQYGPETLRNRSIAFDGTVTAITADQVTFAINQSFRGTDGSSVTLAAPGMTGASVTAAGGPAFAVGQRFLVAGEDQFAWGCGFSQPYDSDVAAEWGRIFGS
jgi:hypothetical protein